MTHGLPFVPLLLRLVPALLLAGVLAAVAIVLRPRDDGEVTAAPAEIGICNASIAGVPEGVEADIVALPVPPAKRSDAPHNTPTDLSLYLFLEVPVPGFDDSRVYIDAATGDRVFEHYRTPEEEALLKEALAMVTVGPWEPEGDAWPRTDTPPMGEVKNKETDPYIGGNLSYRVPDPAAGLFGTMRIGDISGTFSTFNCRSIVQVDAFTDEVIRYDVAPDERDMFDRLLSEIKER